MNRATKRLAAFGAVVAVAAAAGWGTGKASADVENFDVCPSGLTAVATPDTSCAFADSVRRAYYVQYQPVIFAHSPKTDKIYTMQCKYTATTIPWWPVPKNCFGVNDSGAYLSVYID